MSFPKGIDIRQSGDGLLMRAGIDDNNGSALTTGTATLAILEYQSDGTLKQLDFSNNTLTASTPTTPTISLSPQVAPDSTVLGLWTSVLTSDNCANFTVGNIYLAIVVHSALSGVVIRREFQYGSADGDFAMVGSGVQIDLTQAVPTNNTTQTIGDSLNAARAQGFGAWKVVGTTLTLYAADGTTVVHTFTLNDPSKPTARS